MGAQCSGLSGVHNVGDHFMEVVSSLHKWPSIAFVLLNIARQDDEESTLSSVLNAEGCAG